jgi:hypothetical protein
MNYPTIFVGYDPREDEAFRILEYTIETLSSAPVNVYPIDQMKMRRMGLYRRAWMLGSSQLPSPNDDKDIQHRDLFDHKPFATDFSFSRFLTPFLNRLSGWALFMDCDMYFRHDPVELFNTYCDPKFALYCVKHNHTQASNEVVKMYGNEQYQYSRKNWSSVMLYNCDHEAHNNLTIDDVNTKSGHWLHNLKWLPDDVIGDLPEEWNWLDGHSSVEIDAKNVHFTRGGPWFDRWEPLDEKSRKYAKEWRTLLKTYNKKQQWLNVSNK